MGATALGAVLPAFGKAMTAPKLGRAVIRAHENDTATSFIGVFIRLPPLSFQTPRPCGMP